MAWLRLTQLDGLTALVNSDQVTEIYPQKEPANRSGFGSGIMQDGQRVSYRESVDEIAAMIADTERRDRVDGIFRAIVCNFPHGYDPAEIVETARRLMDALDKSREL